MNMKYDYNRTIHRDPEPSLIPPDEDEGVATCYRCGYEIYAHEDYAIEDGGRCICIDCVEEEFNKLQPYEKIETMGYSVGWSKNT